MQPNAYSSKKFLLFIIFIYHQLDEVARQITTEYSKQLDPFTKVAAPHIQEIVNIERKAHNPL